MLALFFISALSANKLIGSLTVSTQEGKFVINSNDLEPGQTTDIELTENQTLALSLETTLKKAPKHSACTLELGMHSIASTFSYTNGKLQLKFTPLRLAKLYKHSGKYSLSILVADDQLEKPFLWNVGTVNFIANNEVVDNFTDVEWDFQPPPATPPAIITYVFTLLMFAPFALLLILLLVNGINCGYFPRNFIDAIFSLAFVGCLGAFFYYFVVFWKSIHFEDMLKSLIPISVVLGVLLRRALIGRAKMVARHEEDLRKAEAKKSEDKPEQ
ncbi:hypothetical protein TRFO_06832 [Tritrichomonas foetus]|uniref:Ribophorin II n=1 Tax=Tritrichomonas foetus TaxID=1144522 RepID=A0A1J4K090_9EUKA|nr:hypothetical protein TRFO_06832 [Tritrichomonas foetus]|eukprot:OHT03158.1 hypothetical protein TRFO_06832 [Tritrichomonas foetus]